MTKEETNYKYWMNRINLTNFITSDVTERFYTKMLYQDEYVLNDFMTNTKTDDDSISKVYNELIGAVLESVSQRTEMTDSQLSSLNDKLTKKIEGHIDEKTELFDFIHHPQNVIHLIQSLAEIAVDQIPDAVVLKFEEIFKKARETDIPESIGFLGEFSSVFPK